MGETAALRIGVAIAGETLPAWQERLLGALVEPGAARLALVVLLEHDSHVRGPGLWLRTYERLDRALFRSQRDALAPKDTSARLHGVPRLAVRIAPRPDPIEADLDPESLRALRAHGLDALIQLTGPVLAGAVVGATQLGVWIFDHEDALRRGGLPFHTALLDGSGAADTRLLADGPTGRRTLYHAVATANPNSLDQARASVLWRAAELPARAVRAFASGYEPPFDGGATLPAAERSPTTRPGALAVTRHVLASTGRVVRNRLQLRREERVWVIAVRRRSETPIASDPLSGFRALSCPVDRFHADPMLVHDGDRHHLFFEDADRATELGAIAWRAIASDGAAGPVHRILERDTHLSYPFVFSWRGSWFMIPETSALRTLELHRAVEFPLRWELKTVLFRDLDARDATVVEHAGRLWMFVAMRPTGATINDELFLFHAEAPTGPWLPHPRNPIVSDPRRARPAGALFREGDTLYRPGQDCAADYGAAFWVNRVEQLDERHYRETPIRRITPEWHPDGLCTHTLARAGEFEAMDNRVWMRRLG